MAKTTPLHDGELLYEDERSGKTWKVKAEHHGHTMRVAGRIMQDGQAVSMLIVRCSCGEAFRMAEASVDKALRKAEL